MFQGSLESVTMGTLAKLKTSVIKKKLNPSVYAFACAKEIVKYIKSVCIRSLMPY